VKGGSIEHYKNLRGDSSVVAYELGQGEITVQWWLVVPLHKQRTGSANISEMQRLALAGRGLNSFIDRFVPKSYAQKWR